jgi:SAM-dependent methyltransferase
MGEAQDPFWEDPARVEEFAARPADQRLQALLAREPRPERLNALDLGCAAGRNSVFLAERGVAVTAVDASRAMVARTRARLAGLVGEGAARRAVHHGPMDRLDWAADAGFDLIVALGIYHNAGSAEEWDRALAETARVLRPGGRLLVSTFTPETDLTGQGHRPVAGVPHLFELVPSGRRLYLVEPETLDRELSAHGFEALEPTTTSGTRLDVGRRVSANGLFRLRGAAAPAIR